jgi:hypothetical protein
MATLTLPPELASVTPQTIRAQSRAWNRLLARLRRLYRTFEWAWIREQNAGRNLHLHLLWTLERVTVTQLSLLANQSGFGIICDIRPIRTQDARNQFINYATKSLGLIDSDPDGTWPPRTRHYRTSLPQLPKTNKDRYTRVPIPSN